MRTRDRRREAEVMALALAGTFADLRGPGANPTDPRAVRRCRALATVLLPR